MLQIYLPYVVQGSIMTGIPQIKQSLALALLPPLGFVTALQSYLQSVHFVDDAQKTIQKLEGKDCDCNPYQHTQEKILLAGMQLMNFK